MDCCTCHSSTASPDGGNQTSGTCLGVAHIDVFSFTADPGYHVHEGDIPAVSRNCRAVRPVICGSSSEAEVDIGEFATQLPKVKAAELIGRWHPYGMFPVIDRKVPALGGGKDHLFTPSYMIWLAAATPETT